MSNIVTQMDTLQIYQRLKKAKASEPLAKEMAEIFRETVEERLATKLDMNLLQKDVKELEIRLQKDLEKTKAELQAEIQKSKSETIKWIIGWVTGLLVAQTGFLFGFLK